MKNVFLKDGARQLAKTLNRFLAIVMITVIGVAFFAGIKYTGPAMRETGDKYLDSLNFMDIHILSGIGFNDEDLAAIRGVSGIKEAEPSYSVDVLTRLTDEDAAVKLLSFGGNINRPALIEGESPQNSGECMADPDFMEKYGYAIGDTVHFLPGSPDDELSDIIAGEAYKITGVAQSPLYMSDDRGTSTVGSGKAEAYFYLPQDEFTIEAYTDVYAVVNDTNGLTRFDDGYVDTFEGVMDALEEVGEVRCEVRYDEVLEDAHEEIADAKVKVADGYQELEDARVELSDGKDELEENRVKLDDAKKELEDAGQKLLDGRAELDDGKAEYEDGRIKFENEMADGQAKIDDGYAQYNEGVREYNDGVAQYDAQAAEAEARFAEAEAELSAGQAQYDEGVAALNQGIELYNNINGLLAMGNDPGAIASLAGIAQQIAGTNPELSAALSYYTSDPENPEAQAAASAAAAGFGAYLDESQAQLDAAKAELDNGYAQLDAGRAELYAAADQLVAAGAQLDAALAELQEGQRQLDEGRATGLEQLNEAAAEISKGEAELADGEKEYLDGLKEYEDGVKEFEDGEDEFMEGQLEFSQKEAEARIELLKAEQDIADAEEDLNDFDVPKWYVLSDETNPGFVSYKQDTQRLDALGDVIPVFFFMLAVFVTMTSMTRLVESDRGWIGTVKALGYSNRAVESRYLLYAVAASATGAILGLVVGYSVLPTVIFTAYSGMYSLTPLDASFPYALSFWSVLLAVVCAVLPAELVCMNSVHEKPSELIRPQSPKSGKRILIERFTPLWKRLSFLHKVTVRNIFRYKKRFIMTIVGVAGCTALMFTGFAIKDAISTIAPKQFGEIFVYDMQVDYPSNERKAQRGMERVAEMEDIASWTPARRLAVDASINGDMAATTLVVPENPQDFQNFIVLRDRSSGEPIALTDEGVVVAERLSTLWGADVGDTISLLDADGNEAEVKLAAITENYLGHYVYMSPGLYGSAFGKEYTPNEGLYILKDDSEAAETALSSELIDMNDVTSVFFASDERGSMDQMTALLDVVVLVLVVSAAMLIFVVLFSLISINIEERDRELATIKVLGFYDNELASYIYRESNILTIIGIVIGIGLGLLLQRFILVTMETNFMMFSRDILWESYVYSAGLTGIFAILVNAMMRRHFRKIDMISSLKSVE